MQIRTYEIIYKLIEEIEASWAAIADHDDWSPLHAKLTAIGQVAEAMQLSAL